MAERDGISSSSVKIWLAVAGLVLTVVSTTCGVVLSSSGVMLPRIERGAENIVKTERASDDVQKLERRVIILEAANPSELKKRLDRIDAAVIQVTGKAQVLETTIIERFNAIDRQLGEIAEAARKVGDDRYTAADAKVDRADFNSKIERIEGQLSERGGFFRDLRARVTKLESKHPDDR